MKLMLVRDRNVLNTNWLVYLANLFIEQGHEVVIACDTYSKLGVCGVGYEINPKVKVCNLNGKTKNAVVNVYRFIRGKIFPSWLRFNHLIKAENPDVIISYFPNDLYNIAPFQNYKAPIVQMIHGWPPYVLNKTLKKNPMTKMWRKMCYKKVHTYQVLMNSFKNDIDSFFEPKNVVRIANPVKQYKDNELVDLGNEKKKIIYVGRIEKKTKRPHLLVEAFAQIAKDFPDWKVELYGLAKYKDYNEEINNYIRDHGLEKQVCLAGYAKDMEALYRTADIQAFPSACEGFSLAIADAMAIGLPHIGFKDAHSVNEIIVDGHNGFLADNVDDFANKLRRLMEDKNLRIQFGKNAYEDMKAYAPEVIMQQWNELFKEITE